MSKTFVNYHIHTMYSNVRTPDSTVTNEDYAKRVVELGHSVLSSCNHGWQGNYWDTIKTAKKYDIKPLVAAEPYWVKDRFEKDRNNCHIFIGALNENGRQALNDVISEANLTGFYGQPRLDIPLILSLPPEDIVVTTACVAYWKYDDIEDITRIFRDHFGKHFFLEVQYHNTRPQIELNQRILRLHNQLKIPLIMGTDSHYIYPFQSQIRDDFLLSKGISYADEAGWYLDYPDGETAFNRFATQCVLSQQEICDAMDNTLIFNEVEEYDCPIFNTDPKMPVLPQYKDKTQEEKNQILKRLVWNGWKEYRSSVNESQWDYYIAEMTREVQTIVDTNMADYFIDNYYIVRKGQENGGPLTKTARGSASGFFVNKLLGFTEVDRIAAKVKMYPERFMTTTRILESGSFPDIDFNCGNVEPFARAQKELFGDDHSYPMIAYNTMKTSAAWKLYAKSQGVPFEIANAVSEQLQGYELDLKETDEEDRDKLNVLDYIDEKYREIYQKSTDYLGLISAWSIHPCSYCLYDGSIRREIGLVKIKDNLCCLMDGHWAEECHFLKNDLLKVSVVDFIYKAFKQLGKDPPSVNELLKLVENDGLTWDIYARGYTIGVNQCEQNSTRMRVIRYRPRNVSELTAFIAAVRPGFKSMYKTFENRTPFQYDVESFDSLVQTEEMPNSFVMYQEQIMTLLNYAGIPLDECYTAIKNIAKKRAEKVFAYKNQFIESFTTKMIEDEGKTPADANALAETLWQIVEDSAGYSFNSSHAYCMALDSLYCAWLKAHHPLEFYETLLAICEEKGDKDKMNALRAEAEDYAKISFPPFRFGQNNSRIMANHENNTITNSIGAIKGLTASVGETLYEAYQQPGHETFMGTLKLLDERGIKSCKVDKLIKIGYFNDYGNVNELLKMLEFWDLTNGGKVKQISKAKVEDEFTRRILEETCDSHNKNGSPSASYKIEEGSAEGILTRFEQELLAKSFTPPPSYKELIQYDMDILGYVDIVTGKDIDRRRLIVLSKKPLKNALGKIWGYRLETKSVGSGKIAVTHVKAEVMDETPLDVCDVIYASDLNKNYKGYWYINKYTKEK